MSSSDSFDDLMGRLRGGDDDAAAEVHRRFVGRLIALASTQFDARVRTRADHEGIVQSVFRNFFDGYGQGKLSPDGWGELWSLLAVMTVRKCGRQRARLRAQRRSADREVALHQDDGWDVPDREPTPDEAAMLLETLERWLGSLDASERVIVELGLQGYETKEIATTLARSERTVRRVRQRAEVLLRAESDGEMPISLEQKSSIAQDLR
jgi:DNA-directed RNA polymerase specialized sigma24 family protein